MMLPKIQRLFTKLRNDRGGNFAVITALLLPVLIPVAGMAIDVTGMMNARSHMRNASDAASLAAANALAEQNVTDAEAKKIVLRYLQAHSEDDFDFSAGAETTIVTTGVPGKKTFAVTVATTYDYELNPLTGMLLVKSKPIAAKSTSISTQEKTTTKSPASFYMVLDRSGSMRDETNEKIGTDKKGKPIYRTKIEALKVAVGKMSDVLHKSDPDWKYVRTGAVAFSSNSFPEIDMEWGTSGVLSYVADFEGDGSTNPVKAIATANDMLMDPKEVSEHKKKNGGVPIKAILYLTDGANNPQSLDTPAMKSCNNAKADGIEIYTVGFMMPKKGKKFLSECATDDKHFFDVDNPAELYAAFEKIGLATAEKMTIRVGE